MAHSLTVNRNGNDSIIAVCGLTGIFVLLALLIAGTTSDPLMSVQAWTFIALAGLFLIGTAMWAGDLIDRDPFDSTEYENTLVKFGVAAAMFWGLAGLLVGVIIACQLAFPSVFYFPDLGWTNFGRLRPLHTSAVIFAFGGNVLLATSFYVVQRTCRARLAGGMWPWFVF